MKPSRRWFQYSLRSFLILLTALAVWLGVVVNRAREQREAVEAIEALGGYVIYDWQIADTPMSMREYGYFVDGTPVGPSWLRQMIGDDYFQEVWEVRFGFDPSWPSSKAEVLHCIPQLRRMRGLRRVELWGHLSELRNELKSALSGCEITVFSPQ